MTEEWRPVVGWEGSYEVSCGGQIRSLNRIVPGKDGRLTRKDGQQIVTRTSKNGYTIVCLCRFRTVHTLYVHRLVAQAFITEVKGKPHVNHIDSVRTNNHVSNLEWCTRSENMCHASEKGRLKHKTKRNGDLSSHRKLNSTQVIEIKKRLESGESTKAIGADYPVSVSAISEIKAGRAWGHIVLT